MRYFCRWLVGMRWPGESGELPDCLSKLDHLRGRRGRVGDDLEAVRTVPEAGKQSRPFR